MSLASPRRKSIALGWVGCTPAWEDAYREVVRRQAKPVSLSGIYHHVPARAEQAARDWECWAAPSLTRLFERSGIDAVAILDAGWQDWYALELAVRFRKPVLMTGPWTGDLSALEQIHLAAREAGVLIMAAFPSRHSPATNRLRELMATKLGPAAKATVELSCTPDQHTHQLIDWIDWCTSVLGRPALGVDVIRSNENSETRQIVLRFPLANLQAELLDRTGESPENSQLLTIDCQHGSARILDEREIEWTLDGKTIRETLPQERSGTEIILDQFCRRVAGGLVPVADLGDLLRSARLAAQVGTAARPT